MDSREQKKSQLRDINQSLLRITLLLIVTGLSFAALVLPSATRADYDSLELNGVAPQDIQAPYTLTYTSQLLTDQSVLEAESRIASVYLPADPSIARQQIETLRSVLNFISTVRADQYADINEKVADLQAIESIKFSYEDSGVILSLSDVRWQAVQDESLNVLEEVMRDTIQEGRINEKKRNLPTLVSLTLPQDQASIVTTLVTPFIVANSLYSQELTDIAREEARQNVIPVQKTYVSGEIIVRRGQIINSLTWEALQQFNMIDTPSQSRELLATSTLIVTMAGFSSLYFSRRKMPIFDNMRSLLVISFAFLLFLFLARLIIPNRTVIPYLFPISAFGLTMAVLFNAELALVLSLVLSILASYGLPNSLDLSIYYIISSMFGILLLGKGIRIGSFITAGFGIGAVGAVVVLAYRLSDPLTDLIGIATLTTASFFSGIASASLTLVLQFLFAQLLGLSTALQLLEISRPDHPLQQFILRNAPGSYQHSLQVSIMAEQAAEKIGADALLVRVGAIYHDAGKALNPSFYIENQIPGNLNPHDDIDPVVSAQTIIRHVTDGVLLAKKHRMPNRIIDFILEHHGTHVTRYQYAKAIEAAGNNPDNVDVNQFRYPGPRPQSRETALLMLADGCQARARAELPTEEFELKAIVRKVLDYCQHENQLDDTRLTLQDLTKIADSFVNTLLNTYHPRIRYPEIKVASPQAIQVELDTPEQESQEADINITAK